jgi:hypothetical protein
MPTYSHRVEYGGRSAVIRRYDLKLECHQVRHGEDLMSFEIGEKVASRRFGGSKS